MNKYIDADRLIHDLEERIYAYSEGYADGDDCRKDAIETLLKDVKYQCSLQQERPGVDFKIEERKWVYDAVDNIFPEDGDFMSEVDFRKIIKATARHFYELGLHPKVEVPEKYKTPDFVFSKQEYEPHSIISTDTTSVKPRELDGKALLYTADKSYQIGFRDGVASVKPAECGKVTINGEPIPTETKSVDIPLAEWSKEDEKMLTELLLTIEPSNNYDEMRNWLLLKLKALLLQGSKDSLQTSWKPSEEQMEAFEDAMTYIPEFYKPKSNLASLLRDLKKLM